MNDSGVCDEDHILGTTGHASRSPIISPRFLIGTYVTQPPDKSNAPMGSSDPQLVHSFCSPDQIRFYHYIYLELVNRQYSGIESSFVFVYKDILYEPKSIVDQTNP